MNAPVNITALDTLKAQCRRFTDYEWLMLADWALEQISDRNIDEVGDLTYDGFHAAFERLNDEFPSHPVKWHGFSKELGSLPKWQVRRDAELARRMVQP